jgi:hypothetical protein
MTVTRYILFFLTIIISYCNSFGQIQKLAFVDLQINGKINYDKKNSILTVPIKAKNRSKENLVLIALKRAFILPADHDSIFFHDLGESGGAGAALILTDAKNERQPESFEDCDDCEGFNEAVRSENFNDSLKSKVIANYSENTVVLQHSKELITTLKYNIRDIALTERCYNVYVIYYVSSDTKDLVNDIVKKRIAENKAVVPIGWVSSNFAKICIDR